MSLEAALKITGYFDNMTIPSELDGGLCGVSLYSLLKSGALTVAEAAQKAICVHQLRIAHASRWVAHYKLRLEYERSLLDEAGGIPASRWDVAVGGLVLIRREWLTVLRVNKRAGRIVSVRTDARFAPLRRVEEIEDYKAPTRAPTAPY